MCICFACNWAYEMLKWLCATQSLVIVAVSSSIHSSFPVEYFSGLSLRFQVAGYYFVVSSRRSHKQSWSPPPPRSFWSATSTVFQKALPPAKSNLHQEYSYHTAIIMIPSLLKKTTTFWDTKIISFYCKWINMRCKINCKSSFSYT